MNSPDETTQRNLHTHPEPVTDAGHAPLKTSLRPLGYFFWFFVLAIVLPGMLLGLGLAWWSAQQLIDRQEQEAVHLCSVAAENMGSHLKTLLKADTAVPGRDGQRAMTLDTDATAIDKVMARTSLPPGWLIGLIDGQGVFVARSKNQDQWTGKAADPELVAAAHRSNAGTRYTRSVAGFPVLNVFNRVPDTTWTLVIGVPESAMYAPVLRYAGVLAGLILLATMLSALVAIVFFRQLNIATARLLTLARDPNSSVKAPTALNTFAEFELVAQTLRSVADSQQRLLAELTKSREQYHALFESIDEGFCLIEMIYDEHDNPVDWRYLEVNPAFEKQNGLYNAVGKRIRELVTDLEPEWFSIFGNVARTGQSTRFQNEAKALDARWFDLYAFRVGEPGSYKVAVLFKDITASKKIEAAAQAASQYTRSLLEASLDPLVTINAQGTITDVNEASVQVTGVSREHLVGTDFSDYFTDPNQARNVYRRVFSEGFVRDYPLAIRHTSGKVIDVLYNASVYKDNDGKVIGVFAAARDVTDRNHLDRVLKVKSEELRTATIAAELANLAKSNFLSNMSHELRTPLNAVLGFAQLIESGSPPPTPLQTESLNQILKGGWYLLELIDEILDLSQIESGKASLMREPVPLDEVMLECQAMIATQAQQRGIALTFPRFESAGFILADRMRIKQVLLNLLSNAIKYNQPGGTVVVAVEPNARAPAWLRISVRDTGKGLAPEQLSQLFQPFNRLGQESGMEQGTGIGLVVTKQLVELMGGMIGVESTRNVGSTFWIELESAGAPLGAAQDVGTGALAPVKPVQEPVQRSVLYVEDNPANLALVEQLLARRPNLHLLCATTGIQGIELARVHQPALILMDINLPGISGLEAMQLLRADPATAHIPVIAISANAMPVDIERGIAAGFFDYLTKPIVVHHFLATLDMALAGNCRVA